MLPSSTSASPSDLCKVMAESPGRNDRWWVYAVDGLAGLLESVVRDCVRLVARWFKCEDFEKTANEMEIAAMIR
jgi:hypothetical protein